jgi:hypothetical protein
MLFVEWILILFKKSVRQDLQDFRVPFLVRSPDENGQTQSACGGNLLIYH